MHEAQRAPRSIILLLGCFSLIGYVLRMNISIAGAIMMPELGLTKIRLGQLFTAFLLGYTLFQIPWGLLSDKFGARAVLTIAALSWGVASIFSGLLPGLLLPAGIASFLGLWALRFLLGLGEAAGFPVAGRAIASSMPLHRHAFAYAIVITGTNVGSAITPPLISALMVGVGWRASFVLTSLLAFALAVVWFVASRRTAALPTGPDTPGTPIEKTPQEPWWRLLTRPALVFLCLSYFLESYVLYVFVFWSYLYLVEQRHFTFLSGGIYTGLPFLVAAILVPLHGWFSDWLTVRRGYVAGRRNVAIVGMLISAAFLLFTVRLANPYLAVAALAISVASQMSTENVFWSSSIEIGGVHAGTAGGIMNTAGNVGGILSTSLVPVLIERWGWTFAFGSAAALAFLSAVVWFWVRVDRDSSERPLTV
jgi:MFS transporter, ACS family, glucarate transporter